MLYKILSGTIFIKIVIPGPSNSYSKHKNDASSSSVNGGFFLQYSGEKSCFSDMMKYGKL